MTNSIGDIEKAQVILVTGSNTTENHPVLSTFVKRAVRFNGAQLIVVDPRRIKLTRFASRWLRQNPGSDVAWINGMMHVIIQEELYDKEFVRTRTANFEALQQAVAGFTPEAVQEITGIPAEDLTQAARLYASGRPATILYTMGITQHTTGTDNVKSLANLAMLCGNIGVEGGGVNPLRGQNNVQGACDMGGLPDVYTAYQKVADPEVRAAMARAWQVDALPESPGLKLTQMTEGALQGSVKSLFIVGENPAVSDPDSGHVTKALENLELLVVQDIFLTETARMADVVLPGCSFAEKDGTFTNTERRVQRVRQAIEPRGTSLPDWKIIAGLSNRMGLPMHYPDSESIFREISAVTPSYAGITYDLIEQAGVHWPCPCQGHPGTPVLHCEQFACGLGQFQNIDYLPPNEQPDADFPLILTTGRVLYQYHTGTMTRKVDGLNLLAPECFVELSSQDAHSYRLQDGDSVEVISRRGSIRTTARISEQAQPGTVFIPFHYAESAANRLTNPAADPVSGIPELKVCAVRLANPPEAAI
jgi:formate dehydrogenase alpha subunit